MISAFVITCDKESDILSAVLKRARFADELILIDKGQYTDVSSIADRYGARYFKVKWTPTVEETRERAVRLCTHDWIVRLDDDEILTEECDSTFRDFVAGGTAEILHIPIHQYILGRHDEGAYYWPEWRSTLFYRGAIEFSNIVHSGIRYTVGSGEQLPKDHPAHIIHLSHPDVATWVEKTNRYTSQPDRSSTKIELPSSYGEAVARLRRLYDEVDALKHWEAREPDGRAAFAEIARAVLEEKSISRLMHPSHELSFSPDTTRSDIVGRCVSCGKAEGLSDDGHRWMDKGLEEPCIS